MSLSDCSKCWETPCICGYMYKKYSKKKRIKLAAAVLNINEKRLIDILEIDKKMKTKITSEDEAWNPI